MIDRKEQLAILEAVASRFIPTDDKSRRLAQLLDMHLTRDGYRLAPIDERHPGEAVGPRHNGQHRDCTVCRTKPDTIVTKVPVEHGGAFIDERTGRPK